jgi:hypothetical protein
MKENDMENKQTQIEPKDASSEQLALMLQARYQAIIQIQNEIVQINNELNRRLNTTNEINQLEKEIADGNTA